MRLLRIFSVVVLATICISQSPAVNAGFGDFLKGIQEKLTGGELSESKIIQGLKEALQIGTENAVKLVSQKDGYLDNPKIRIPLPDQVQKVEKALRAIGYGQKVDEFEISMNNAAEQAAPEAKFVFLNAIKVMSFTDAKKILNGQDNEATFYFKDKTSERLHEIFKPIISNSMSNVGATNRFKDMNARLSAIPFVSTLSFDLDKYVTDKALNGLFLMVEEEERKIRQDPATRVTDVLKEVFGSRE
jgi:hypothetical protein